MMGPNAYRGQPLVVLGLLVGGWMAVRVILWDSSRLPVPVRLLDAPLVASAAPATAGAPIAETGLARAAGPRWSPMPPAQAFRGDEGMRRDEAMRAGADFLTVAPARTRSARLQPAPIGLARPAPPTRMPGAPAGIAAGHQMMWMAALARLPVPLALAAYRPPQAAPFLPSSGAASAPSTPARRWSADAWLLIRQAGNLALATGLAPTSYGASQGGGVLRYRLDPQSRHRPAAYLRATAALDGSREKEAALGFSARPLATVPVVAAAELRATSVPGATRVRPAAFAYTELPPIALPMAARGEAYLQAGYIGGGFATGFVDGQLRVDRRVSGLGPAELRLGAGLWGGAQRSAARVDAGPSATLTAAGNGTAAARVAIDWRFRVAGNAAPASGPALTLSAGF